MAGWTKVPRVPARPDTGTVSGRKNRSRGAVARFVFTFGNKTLYQPFQKTPGLRAEIVPGGQVFSSPDAGRRRGMHPRGEGCWPLEVLRQGGTVERACVTRFFPVLVRIVHQASILSTFWEVSETSVGLRGRDFPLLLDPPKRGRISCRR